MSNRSSKIRSIIYGILILLAALELFDILGGYDYIKAGLYKPTAETQAIMDELKLTERGERIMKAVRPSLESRDTFNSKCESHNAEIYILGCYLTGEDTIHLYNVDDAELDGIIESTAAHELLHAVYSRLPFWEKNSLNKKLQSVYDSLDEDSDIKASMELYSKDDFYDELHSRLGTEVKTLPDDLESHYAAIFSNQDGIVDFYENYSATFKKYEDELTSLETRIVALREEINNESARLSAASSALNSKIDGYNSRVKSHSYTSVDAIRAEGEGIQKEINDIESAYKALNQKIKECNDLIEEYDNNVIRTNQIFDSINSNSSQIKTVTN